MSQEASEITRLVSRWSEGEEEAFDRLIELVYDDLRQMAHRHLARVGRDEILDTTVLVHEAYVKLAGLDSWSRRGKAQFFAFCSKAMRRILIDFARKRHAEKRGGTRVQVPLDENTAAVDADIADILAVEDALLKLEAKSQRMSRIVECRYFGGMTVPETAAALGTSSRTVEREWARARAYLLHALAYQGEESARDTPGS